MAEQTYLDWNATARLRPQARDAMLAALDAGGNPSSVHGAGRQARRTVERAREQVAALAGVEPRQVVFTSGGTEANAIALSPALGDSLVVSAVEHPSVRSGGRFGTFTDIPVTPAGVVDLAALRTLLERSPRPLVSIMLANNETGAIQPVAEAAEIVHAAGGLLHVDAVQGPGRIPTGFDALGIDLMTLAAHKFGGPQGVGALIKRESIDLDALVRGGGQERGARAGTENVPGIAGLGAAAAAVAANWEEEASRMAGLRHRLEAGLAALSPEAVVFAVDAPRLPNTTLFAVPGLKAETAVIGFDLEGICVSSGSACSSGKVAASHVLSAMGADPALAGGAIRVSLGYGTTDSDVERFLKAWAKLAEGLYKSRKLRENAA